MSHLGPYIVPVVAMLIPIVAIISGAVTQIYNRQSLAQQRIALIARGVPLAEIEAFMKASVPEADEERPVRDPMRSLGHARRAAVVLISVGAGLLAFLLILGVVVLWRVDATSGWIVMACSASGLIPVLIGVGFAFDYKLQAREMSRFGLEVEADRR